MRLAKIYIRNFRSFKEETIHLDDYACFVGPNGAGKSTVLAALNVVFRNQKDTNTDVYYLGEEDFHHKDTGEPVRIELTFEDLSREAQEDFKAYYRQGQLVVSADATWDEVQGRAEVVQHGWRWVMKAFVPFFEKHDARPPAPAAELKAIYKELRSTIPELPVEASKEMNRAALREYEESHPQLCEAVQGNEQFYGWTRGANRLAQHAQWVYVPAVKEASSEQQEGTATALGALLKRAVRTKVDFEKAIGELREDTTRAYEELIAGKKGELDDLRASLKKRLKEWSHDGAELDLEWGGDRTKSPVQIAPPVARAYLGEHGFMGDIARLGHGMQRAFLLALLQELVSSDALHGPRLLLGLEEPELYQHPPQARHMASILQALPGKNAQVLLTTHSPYFVSAMQYAQIRMVRKCPKKCCTKVSSATCDAVRDEIKSALGEDPGPTSSVMAVVEQVMQPSQRELFFTSVAVLVEGLEDVAFIATHLNITGKWQEFRRLGCHIVAAGSKSCLSRFVAIAKQLLIPFFVVFDADGDQTGEQQLKENKRDNLCLLRLCGVAKPNPMPEKPLVRRNVAVWPANISSSVRDDFGENAWCEATTAARASHGFGSRAVSKKNQLLIAAILEELHRKSKHSSSLEKLCERILRLARKPRQ